MKRSIPLGLIAVGMMLVVGAFAWAYFGDSTISADAIALPDQLGNLPRTDYRTGIQAIAEFENLHGKQFPLIAGAIGIYGNQQITVWAAGTSSDSTAAQMVAAMRERIAEGNSPFTPLRQATDKNRTIYVLEGMGQEHFYFQSKNLVIWVAVDPAFVETVKQQILEAYP
jgi:hypothetical protein